MENYSSWKFQSRVNQICLDMERTKVWDNESSNASNGEKTDYLRWLNWHMVGMFQSGDIS